MNRPRVRGNLTQKARRISSRELRNTRNYVGLGVDLLKCCNMQREQPLIFYWDVL
jgi:hypothetical protein